MRARLDRGGWGPAAALILVVVALGGAAPLGPTASAAHPAALEPTAGSAPALRPVHATPGPGIHLHPGVVFPTYDGGSEPAPMGITDFGVTPDDTPYSYATPIWLGSVTIPSAPRTTGPGSDPNMGFQLNVVLFFRAGGSNYSYWVQNVVIFNTSNDGIFFENNIWNFSGPSPPLASGELTGNGTTAYASGIGYWYYCVDQTVGEGNAVRLTFPATVQAEVRTGVFGGVPRVEFLYDDGFGWQSFDNVSFNHATNWKDLGFVVDGYNYAAISPGIFADAEWDFTGDHFGYTDERSNFSMGLQYWNGHNFQEPPNAFNFGGDTGESMKNVVPKFSVGADGTLNDTLTNGSTGSLGSLYGASSVATLDTTMPGQGTGVVQVGNRSVPYVHGAMNLTLSPGRYPVSLWINGTQRGLTDNLTLVAGETLDLQLPFYRTVYPVSYEESGLPAGTSWGITFGNVTNQSMGAWVNFTLLNGSYAGQVGAVPGFFLESYSVNVTVDGGGSTELLTWAPFEYSALVTTQGIGATVPWTLVVTGGPTVQGVGEGPYALELANGSYSYNVTTLAWIAPLPAAGNLTIAGGAYGLELFFGPAPSSIAGLVQPTNATVTIDGVPAGPVASNGTFLVPTLPAGTYTLVASAPGYVSETRIVTTTAGNVSAVTFGLILSTGSSGSPGSGGGSGTSGSPTDWTDAYLGIIALAAVALGVLAFVLRRPPSRRS